MHCLSCGRRVADDETYSIEGKPLCEGCAMMKGLFPLEHRGLRRDKISERGRRLAVADPAKIRARKEE